VEVFAQIGRVDFLVESGGVWSDRSGYLRRVGVKVRIEVNVVLIRDLAGLLAHGM
jgi:hypothetical protein